MWFITTFAFRFVNYPVNGLIMGFDPFRLDNYSLILNYA